MGFPLHSRLLLRAIQARDRAKLRALTRRNPGVEIDPAASTNFAVARLDVEPGGRLRIAAGAVTERAAGGLRIWVGEGAELEIAEDTWLRVETGPLALFVFPGARLSIGRDSILSACSITAKAKITLGCQVWVGPGSQIYDCEHALDLDRGERLAPVRVGDYSWIATDVTVLRGVAIGAHSVVGARSLVSRSIPDHSLAFGTPAVVRGTVGDRTGLRP
jgi:acetyltransferase-like isoleucine patch superfamily enzyme